MNANKQLQKAIQDYAHTRSVFHAYRASGYSKKYFEEHRQELTIYRAARDVFRESGGDKIPTIKELREEYAALSRTKQDAYRKYHSAKTKMMDLLKAKKNLELFYGRNAVPEKKHHADRAL